MHSISLPKILAKSSLSFHSQTFALTRWVCFKMRPDKGKSFLGSTKSSEASFIVGQKSFIPSPMYMNLLLSLSDEETWICSIKRPCNREQDIKCWVTNYQQVVNWLKHTKQTEHICLLWIRSTNAIAKHPSSSHYIFIKGHLTIRKGAVYECIRLYIIPRPSSKYTQLRHS